MTDSDDRIITSADEFVIDCGDEEDEPDVVEQKEKVLLAKLLSYSRVGRALYVCGLCALPIYNGRFKQHYSKVHPKGILKTIFSAFWYKKKRL